MTMYPKTLADRFAAELKAILRRITKLESRTASIDSGFPLAALPAVVDPAYTSGDPEVFINGAGALSGPYSCLSIYTPVAGDSVIVLPVGALQTYIILGKTI